MARLPRLSLPELPHHVVQRGHNRQPIFLEPGDYADFHRLLHEQSRQHAVAVHAYVLMPNHVHLLVTPTRPDALGRMMQGVGRSYVRGFNARNGRSGTLWEGRFRSSLLQPETHLLACMAYQDLNPVRAALVEEASAWEWSSHRHYIGRHVDRLVTPHPLFWQIGNTPFAREHAYAQLVAAGLGPAMVQALTDAALHGWALGDAAFLADVQARTQRRVIRGNPGRPRTKTS
ncbi:transposase [Ramlibacter sp. AN1015]|uniref:transposase n=1 Tax=Ramlibacter sp. AN1015 TaxID=3133428 RepID=UPI0030BDFA06